MRETEGAYLLGVTSQRTIVVVAPSTDQSDALRAARLAGVAVEAWLVQAPGAWPAALRAVDARASVVASLVTHDFAAYWSYLRAEGDAQDDARLQVRGSPRWWRRDEPRWDAPPWQCSPTSGRSVSTRSGSRSSISASPTSPESVEEGYVTNSVFTGMHSPIGGYDSSSGAPLYSQGENDDDDEEGDEDDEFEQELFGQYIAAAGPLFFGDGPPRSHSPSVHSIRSGSSGGSARTHTASSTSTGTGTVSHSETDRDEDEDEDDEEESCGVGSTEELGMSTDAVVAGARTGASASASASASVGASANAPAAITEDIRTLCIDDIGESSSSRTVTGIGGRGRCARREFCADVGCRFGHTQTEREAIASRNGRLHLGKQRPCAGGRRCASNVRRAGVCGFLHDGEVPFCAACLGQHEVPVCTVERSEVADSVTVAELVALGCLVRAD